MRVVMLAWLGIVTSCISGSSATSSSAAVPPTIVHVVADDLGWNDLGYTNQGKTHTPHINKARQEGIELKYYYTWKVCSPSRASVMTGRYPWGVGYYDMQGSEAVPLPSEGGYEMLPAVLKKHVGYETHALGKWNLGHLTKEYTPTFRGFDSFLGYYQAAQPDYWLHGSTESCCGSKEKPLFCTDLSKSNGYMVADGVRGAPDALNGTYNSEIFTSEAVRIIQEHAAKMTETQKPLYLYVAFMNVHSTGGSSSLEIQAPCEVIDKHYSNTHEDTYKAMGGMLTMLDFGIGNITAALAAAGHPYVLIFHSDNGGPPYDGSTNAPLRGGKHTIWEGGIRVRSFVTGSLIRKKLQGTQFTGLAHSSDWYRTIVAGIANASAGWEKTTGPRPTDGFNLWPAMLSGKYLAKDPLHPGPRNEIIHQVVNQHSSSGPFKTKTPATITKLFTRPGSSDMTYFKLMLGRDNPKGKKNAIVAWPDLKASPVSYGQSGGTRNHYPGESNRCRAPGIDKSKTFSDPQAPDCTNDCLFDIGADPSEKHNIIKNKDMEHIVKNLKKILTDAAANGPPWAIPFQGNVKAEISQGICNQTRHTGYLEPVLTHHDPGLTETALLV